MIPVRPRPDPRLGRLRDDPGSGQQHHLTEGGVPGHVRTLTGLRPTGATVELIPGGPVPRPGVVHRRPGFEASPEQQHGLRLRVVRLGGTEAPLGTHLWIASVHFEPFHSHVFA